MVLNYKEFGRPHADRYADGVRQMDELAAKLAREGKLPERFNVQFREFTQVERQRIKDNGGVLYLPTGRSIIDQKAAQAQEHKPSFWYLASEQDGLIAVRSRRIEIAIFPDPKEFFVPGSFNQDTTTQEAMATEDAKRLGLPNVTQIIIDEASTLSELVFQHFDAAGKWLFGEEYAQAQRLDVVYGRTKNPTNSTGSDVAIVGHARPNRGLDIPRWYRDLGIRDVGVPRLGVALENR